MQLFDYEFVVCSHSLIELDEYFRIFILIYYVVIYQVYNITLLKVYTITITINDHNFNLPSCREWSTSAFSNSAWCLVTCVIMC